MISFRFYVVSVTAFFLALTVGIVVGSTFVDRAIVDNLRGNIDSVSNDLDARKATNDRLESEARHSSDYIDQTAPIAVAGTLTDDPVLVVAQRGINGDAVRKLVELSQQAGAEAPGILWIEPKWSLADDADRDALRDLLSAEGTSRQRLRDRAWATVVDELAAAKGSGPSGSSSTTTRPTTTRPPTTRPTTTRPATTLPAGTVPSTSVPPGPTTTRAGTPPTRRPVTPTTADLRPRRPKPQPTVLRDLLGTGFLSFQPVGDTGEDVVALAGRGPQIVFATGTNGDTALLPLLPRMLRRQVVGGLTTVAAEDYQVQDNGPARGERLTALVGDDLRDDVSTVDNIDLAAGRVTAVLTLVEMQRHRVGHYGFGKGADRAVPAPAP